MFSQDATVFGGSLGEVYGEKIVKVMDLALKTGIPMIGINDGGGARIQEGVVALGLYGEIFMRNVRSSGVIPQISLIMGACAGGAVYSPAITDFTVMVDHTSHMFITGPDVIKTVTGEDVEMEDLGGGRAHNTKSGVAHYLAADETDALSYVKELLSFLPSNNLSEPPSFPPAEPIAGSIADSLDATDLELDTVIPDSPNQPYDMHEVITRVLDDGRVPRGPGPVGTQHRRRVRPGRGPQRRRGRQPAHPVRRLPGHRRIGEGRPLRPHLRRLQHPGADLRRRPRVPARHRAGVGRHHPPRGQADLRLRARRRSRRSP